MRVAGAFFVGVSVRVLSMTMPAATVNIFQATQDGSMFVRFLVAHDLDEFSVMLIAMAFHVAVLMFIFAFVGVVIVIMGVVIVLIMSVVIVLIMSVVIVLIMSVVIIVIVGVVIVLIMSVVIIVIVSVVIVFIMGMVIFVIVGVVIVLIMGMVIIVIVGVVITFMHVPGSANGNDLDASRDFHDRTVFGSAFNHSQQGFFNAGAIDEDEIGFRQRRQLARARLKSVRVGADRNQRREVDAIARNIVDDIR